MKENECDPETVTHQPRSAGELRTRVIEVPVNTVLPADSPRSAGSSSTHARLLAETDADLPPILVHRQTMRVIDGMHRLEAARLRATPTIKAQFFDGDVEEAFVLAVETNVRHGLPLSLADRKAAALRILKAHPQWSDRAVAHKAGLTHKTVGTLRRQSTGEIPQLETRIGLDGRPRPIRSAERCTGGAAVARATGRDSQAAPPTAARVSARALVNPGTDWNARLQRLRCDPSLRYTQTGQLVLRTINAHVATAARWPQIAEEVPLHCLDTLANFVRKCAEDLQRLSHRLEQRRDENM